MSVTVRSDPSMTSDVLSLYHLYVGLGRPCAIQRMISPTSKIAALSVCASRVVVMFVTPTVNNFTRNVKVLQQ